VVTDAAEQVDKLPRLGESGAGHPRLSIGLATARRRAHIGAVVVADEQNEAERVGGRPIGLGGCREREVRVPGLESALRPEIRAEEDERPEQHRRRGRDDRHHGSGLVDVEIVVGVSDGDAQTEIRQPHEVADEVMDDVVADTAPARPGRLSRPSSTACLGSGCIASHRPTFTQVAPLGNSFRPAKERRSPAPRRPPLGCNPTGFNPKASDE
jgi:hypothetical protein